jgi:hypothetical protein
MALRYPPGAPDRAIRKIYRLQPETEHKLFQVQKVTGDNMPQEAPEVFAKVSLNSMVGPGLRGIRLTCSIA